MEKEKFKEKFKTFTAALFAVVLIVSVCTLIFKDAFNAFEYAQAIRYVLFILWIFLFFDSFIWIKNEWNFLEKAGAKTGAKKWRNYIIRPSIVFIMSFTVSREILGISFETVRLIVLITIVVVYSIILAERVYEKMKTKNENK